MSTLDSRTAPSPRCEPSAHRPPRPAVRRRAHHGRAGAALLTIPSTLAVVLLALQAVVFAIGAVVGVQRSRTACCSAGSSGRGSAAPASSRTPAPPRFAQAVGLGVRARRARSGSSPAPTARRLVATGFALAAAFLNAAFGFCLGCEVYLLVRRSPPAPRPPDSHRTHPHRTTRHPTATERSYQHEPHRRPRRRRLGRGPPRRPEGRPRRGRRGHHRLRQEPHPQRHPHRLEATTCRTRSAATSSTRSSSRRCCPRKGIANDDTVVLYGGNNNWFAAYAYWYFKLYGHEDVKLLDGGRKKWELDSPRAGRPSVPTRAATTYTAKEQDTSIRAFRDEVVDGDRQRRTSSTCARPTSTPAAARPGPPAAGAVAARRPHPDRARTSRGARPPTTTAPSSPTTSSRSSTPRPGVDLGQGHHRLLPHRRALGAHLVRAARAARPAERQELRRLLDRVRLARRRARRSSATSPARPKAARLMCGATDGRPVARRGRRGQGGRHPGHRRPVTASPVGGAYVRLLDAPASSPPRSRRRRPGSSGSSPRPASGRCARWRPARPVDRTVVAAARRGRRGRGRRLAASRTGLPAHRTSCPALRGPGHDSSVGRSVFGCWRRVGRCIGGTLRAERAVAPGSAPVGARARPALARRCAMSLSTRASRRRPVSTAPRVRSRPSTGRRPTRRVGARVLELLHAEMPIPIVGGAGLPLPVAAPRRTTTSRDASPRRASAWPSRGRTSTCGLWPTVGSPAASLDRAQLRTRTSWSSARTGARCWPACSSAR